MSTIYYFIVSITIHSSYGVIYNLNESDYIRMPPLYHLADYRSCIAADDKYCTIDFTIVNHSNNDLYDMIREYSSFDVMHFNYTKLIYGKCLKEFCPKAKKFTNEKDLSPTLEGCLNDTFTKSYGLQTRVNSYSCSKDKMLEVEMRDIFVGSLLMLPMLLALLGSVHHYISNGKEQDNKFLSCFSIPRNVRTLFSERSTDRDQRLKGLRALNGMRTITSICVIMTHASLPLVIGNDNPKEFEELFKYFKYVSSGTLVVQTFFVMSGFLLSYNTLIFNEKVPTKLIDFPKGIIMRWLRLTPPILLMLSIVCTWLRFTEYGPMWQTMLGDMVTDCRRQWWPVPLYYINYVDNSQCVPELWYLSADFQLTILGLFSLVFLRGRVRVGALFVMMLVGLVIPSYLTYVYDLNIATVINIQTGRDFFVKDVSFNYLYKRTHNNITDYVMGLLTGMLVHHWQSHGYDLKKYPVIKYLIWTTFPICLCTVLTGSMFYSEAPTPSIIIRIGYLVVSRLAWGAAICVLMANFVLGIETLYSGVLGWRGWTVPARLSYPAYVIHVLIIRCLSGFHYSLGHITPGIVAYSVLFPVVLSFVLAAPVWILIEAPISNLIKLIISPGTKAQKHDNVTTNCKQVPLHDKSSETETYRKTNDN